MDSELVSQYRHAVLNLEGDPNQTVEEKILTVLKCHMWSTLVTDEWELDEPYREKLSRMKHIIDFIGLDQPHRDSICLLRTKCLSEEDKENVFTLTRELSEYFDREMKEQMDRYFTLND